MAGMNVDFNNVRKQACYSYDSLVEKLNRAILKDDQWPKPDYLTKWGIYFPTF